MMFFCPLFFLKKFKLIKRKKKLCDLLLKTVFGPRKRKILRTRKNGEHFFFTVFFFKNYTKNTNFKNFLFSKTMRTKKKKKENTLGYIFFF